MAAAKPVLDLHYLDVRQIGSLGRQRRGSNPTRQSAPSTLQRVRVVAGDGGATYLARCWHAKLL